MALKRADIRKILENAETSNDDKAKAILDALHEETDALRDELDTEKNARVAAEKERDAANGGKQAAEKALTDYKTQQTAKESRAAKAAKCRELLKQAGVLDSYIDDIVNDSKKGEDFINALELDAKGEIKDAAKQLDKAKAEFGSKIATKTTKGAPVDNPPANIGSKMTKDQIFAIKDAGERQAAIAANADLFTGGGKE